MDPIVAGALIGFGGSTIVSLATQWVAANREKDHQAERFVHEADRLRDQLTHDRTRLQAELAHARALADLDELRALLDDAAETLRRRMSAVDSIWDNLLAAPNPFDREAEHALAKAILEFHTEHPYPRITDILYRMWLRLGMGHAISKAYGSAVEASNAAEALARPEAVPVSEAHKQRYDDAANVALMTYGGFNEAARKLIGSRVE